MIFTSTDFIGLRFSKRNPNTVIHRPDNSAEKAGERLSTAKKQTERKKIEKLTAEWLEREGLDEVPLSDPAERTGACEKPENFQLGGKSRKWI